ncbi:MAG: DUF2092 domain-containing protein [Bacteroidetes bacterium]|nr:DUF2092 domain-containing protein [Bacteroidota bacterium]
MKKYLLLLLLIGISLGTYAQVLRFDSTALLILERMSGVITELQSCRLKAHATYDEFASGLGLIKHSEDADLIIRGPDKLFIAMNGYKGERSFFYNGKTLSYYSYSNNRYTQIPAPKTILELADSVYTNFGIDLYAIDFFYPDFIDQLTQNSTSLALLGPVSLNGKDCFQIAGNMDSFSYQIWIQNDPFSLPVKVVMVYTDKPMNPQFECDYEWELNQVYPDAVFEFAAPSGVGKISIAPSKK